METFEDVKKNIYAFAKKYKLNEISNINNDSNLQIIFSNNELKMEFIRDRGEFDIYIGFFNITTNRDIYSVVLLAKILSKKDFSEANSRAIIEYLDLNLNTIKNAFTENSTTIEPEYNIAFSNSFW